MMHWEMAGFFSGIRGRRGRAGLLRSSLWLFASLSFHLKIPPAPARPGPGGPDSGHGPCAGPYD